MKDPTEGLFTPIATADYLCVPGARFVFFTSNPDRVRTPRTPTDQGELELKVKKLENSAEHDKAALYAAWQHSNDHAEKILLLEAENLALRQQNLELNRL
jgi:hypothetical protein